MEKLSDTERAQEFEILEYEKTTEMDKVAGVMERTKEAHLQLKMEELRTEQERLKHDAEVQRTEQERIKGDAAIACAVQERLKAEEKTKQVVAVQERLKAKEETEQVVAVEERKKHEAMARKAEAEALRAQAETQLMLLAQQKKETQPSEGTHTVQEASVGEVSEKENQ